MAPHPATSVMPIADRCSRSHLRGSIKPRHPVWKSEHTTGKAAHTIPTIRVADMRMPCAAAKIFADDASAVLQ